MKTLDFIVHPEQILSAEDSLAREVFADRLVKIAKNRDAYIVISSYVPVPQDKKDKKLAEKMHPKNLVPLERMFRSNSAVHETGGVVNFGHIKSKDFERLKETITFDVKEIRIHGCFYDHACTQSLATQLYGLIKHNKHWYDWNPLPKDSMCILENLRVDLLETHETLEKTNIRYGTVFSQENIEGERFIPYIPKWLRTHPLDKQLTDDKTLIFGK